MSTVLVVDDQPWFLLIDDWQRAIPDVTFVVERDPLNVASRDMSDVICVFLDHRMPRMTGAQVACALRAQGYTGVIYSIGSYAEPGYPDDCIRTGKMLSIRKVRLMVDLARGLLSLSEFQDTLNTL